MKTMLFVVFGVVLIGLLLLYLSVRPFILKVQILLQSWQDEKKKAEEYFQKIEGVLKERDQWRELYNDQAAGHHNAQVRMLQTIASLVRQYRAKVGSDPQVDPLIGGVLEDWQLVHGPDQMAKHRERIEGNS